VRKLHRTDWALDTAREVLRESVCECGHMDTEHAGAEGRQLACEECSCRRFRPVPFEVHRA